MSNVRGATDVRVCACFLLAASNGSRAEKSLEIRDSRPHRDGQPERAGDRQRERERERERESQTETDRQTDRHTDKQRQTFEAAVEFRDLTHGGALAGAMVIRLRQARKL